MKLILDDIKDYIEEISNLNILVIGEIIIDQYQFGYTLGKAGKAPIVAFKNNHMEEYEGGILAIKNHLKDFCKVEIYTGDTSIIKKRYIENGQKLFETYSEIARKHQLSKIKFEYGFSDFKDYDVVIVADFGHGMLDKKLREKIVRNAKFLALNCQLNAGNMAMNSINKYERADYICIDQYELRLATSCQYEPIEEVIEETFSNKITASITLSKDGCIVYKNGKLIRMQSLINPNEIIDASIDGDCKLYWKENGVLQYGTMKNLHHSYKIGNKIEVLSLIDSKNKNMRHTSNTGYPSIKVSSINWKAISESFNHGLQDVYEIELKNGMKIIATKSHSFFKSSGFKSSMELSYLDKTDSLISVSKFLDGNHKENNLNLITFLGLWIADGSFGSKGNINISTGLDSKIISFIKTINPKFKDYGKKGDYGVWDIPLRKEMKRLGICDDWKSKTKRIPEWLFTSSKEELCAFLKGYFSGDGCVHKHKRGSVIIQSSSINRDLSKDIHILLSRLGIRSVIGKGNKNGTKSSYRSNNLNYSLTINWVKSVKLFRDYIGFINKDIPCIKESTNKTQKSDLQRIGIRKIKYMGKKEVYDLSVPETESFVVEGILCHNTGAGDAFLSITAPLAYLNASPEIIGFVGNCAGAIACSYIGNKEHITKKKLYDYLEKNIECQNMN